MFNFPIKFEDKTKIYSFGKVIEVFGDIYSIQYKEYNLKLKYDKNLSMNDFIMFYGKLVNDVVVCEYLEMIEGVDYNILDKFVVFLNKNNLK